MTITPDEWKICKICGKTIEEITVKHKRMGAYKSQYFKEHLYEEHGLTLTEYFPDGPLCPCGQCNKRLEVTTKGATIRYKKMACGRHKGTLEWAEKAKTNRRGEGNPMFQRKAWNKGLTKEESLSLQKTSIALTNRTISNETRKRQSESAKRRTVHGHAGHKHSEELKQLARERTLSMIRDGKFRHTNTGPSLRLESILQDMKIVYEKEKVLGCWSFDFYLPDYDTYVEVDGDYFHSNPARYPDGPKTKTQKINFYRDKKKDSYCHENGIHLIRLWETEIYGEETCVRQKLLALPKLV